MLHIRPLRNDPRSLLHESIAVDMLNTEVSAGMAAVPISEFLRLLQKLDGIRTGLPPGQYLGRKGKAICNQVNRILARHKWSPGIIAGLYEFEEFPQFSHPVKYQVAQVSMWQLLGKLRTGDILKFKQCSDCQLWFYAKTEHQRFCKDACRKRYASKSSEYKTKRKVYMRSYRRMEKQRDRQAKAEIDSKRH